MFTFLKISLAVAWRWVGEEHKIEAGALLEAVAVIQPREEGGWSKSQQTC